MSFHGYDTVSSNNLILSRGAGIKDVLINSKVTKTQR